MSVLHPGLLHKNLLLLAIIVVTGATQGCSKVKLINAQKAQDLVQAEIAMLTPLISSIVPSAGSVSGGTRVTIYGDNFVPGMTIRFGNVACNAVQFVSKNEVRCTTAAYATITLVDVVLTSPSGTVASRPQAYAYVNAVEPKACVSSGGIGMCAGVVSGGNSIVATGGGGAVMMHATAGEAPGQMVQSGTGINKLSGVQGVLYDP